MTARSSVYYRDSRTELHVGDALEVVADMPSGSVDCVVTSPPFWGSRDYRTGFFWGGDPNCAHTLGTTPTQLRSVKGHSPSETADQGRKECRRCPAVCYDQQYGHEPTPDGYIHRLRSVFAELWRVLTPEGTAWLNLADSYNFHSHADTLARYHHADHPTGRIAPHKNLYGIPWRVAFALQDDGWILRNAIIWHKPNARPEPVTDRFSTRYEMLFLLVKQRQYVFNLDAIRQPYTDDRPLSRKAHYGGTKDNTLTTRWIAQGQKGKNPGDVWSFSTRPLKEAHCAPFPIDLPLRCIAAGSHTDALVLDPFSGAGTTGLAAYQLGRRYRAIDLRSDYHDMFLRRRAHITPTGNAPQRPLYEPSAAAETQTLPLEGENSASTLRRPVRCINDDCGAELAGA